MHVNISRVKFLINNQRLERKARSATSVAERCFHCGGAIRQSGDMEACLMCAREKGHICERCSHVPENRASKNKKSA